MEEPEFEVDQNETSDSEEDINKKIVNWKVEKLVETIYKVSSECGAATQTRIVKKSRKKKSCNLTTKTRRAIDRRRKIAEKILKKQYSSPKKLETLIEDYKQATEKSRMLVKKDKIDDWRQYIEKIANLATTPDMKSLWNELRKLSKPSKDKMLIQPIRNKLGDMCMSLKK